jgi:hypothetical protein
MRTVSIVLLAGAFAFCSQDARGENLPSFGVRDCAWHATHIVEVTQGMERKGVLTVRDSWKGDLRKGDVLTFPELGNFATEEQRKIFNREKALPNRVTHVSSLRMVVFLCKNDKGRNDPKSLPIWGGAGWGRDVKASVAWLDGDEVFAYVQIANPGPQVLLPLEVTEKQFKAKVMEIVRAKETFQQAVQVKELGKRALCLRPLVLLDIPACERDSIEALGQCGEQGLPVIQSLLNQNLRENIAPELIRTMGKIGGEKAGKELASYLKDEFAFWKQRGPQLKSDWWQDQRMDNKERRYLQNRSAKFNAILNALAEAKNTKCQPLVREVDDFVKEHPHVGGESATRWCQVILAAKD